MKLDAQQQSTLFLVLALLCIVIGVAISWVLGADSRAWRFVGSAIMILGGSQFAVLSSRKHSEVQDERRRARRQEPPKVQQ